MYFDTEKHLEELIKQIKKEKSINTENTWKEPIIKKREVEVFPEDSFKNSKEISVNNEETPKKGTEINYSYAKSDKSGEEIETSFTEVIKGGSNIEVSTDFSDSRSGHEFPVFDIKEDKIEKTIEIEKSFIVKDGIKIDTPENYLIRNGKDFEEVRTTIESKIRNFNEPPELAIDKGGGEIHIPTFELYKSGKSIEVEIEEKNNKIGKVLEVYSDFEERNGKFIEQSSDFINREYGFLELLEAESGNETVHMLSSIEEVGIGTKISTGIEKHQEKYSILRSGENIIDKDFSTEIERTNYLNNSLTNIETDFSSSKSSHRIISGRSVLSGYAGAIMSPFSTAHGFNIDANRIIGAPEGSQVVGLFDDLLYDMIPITDKQIESTLASAFKYPPNISLIKAMGIADNAVSSVTSLVSSIGTLSSADLTIENNPEAIGGAITMLNSIKGIKSSVHSIMDAIKSVKKDRLNRGRADLLIQDPDKYLEKEIDKRLSMDDFYISRLTEITKVDNIETWKERKYGLEIHDEKGKLKEDFVEEKYDVKREYGNRFKKLRENIYLEKYDVERNTDIISDLGYIYVTPTFSSMLINDHKFFKIPIQSNLIISGDSIEAEYNKIDFLNRVGSVVQFVRTGSRTYDVKTKYNVMSSDGTSNYEIEDLQNIEYMYRSLVLPQKIETENDYYLSRPPVVNIVYGYGFDEIEEKRKNKEIFPNNISINKRDRIINNFFTNIKWEKDGNLIKNDGSMFYKSFVVTSLTIEKDDTEIPMYMERTNKSTPEYYPKDYMGFEVSMTLLEIDPNYLDVNPTMNDYYNFSHRNKDNYYINTPTTTEESRNILR